MSWCVYILRCSDNSLYTGITTDVTRRLQEHNGESNKPGARYTRARRPVTLVYQENHTTRSDACQREIAIKKMSRDEKMALLKS